MQSGKIFKATGLSLFASSLVLSNAAHAAVSQSSGNQQLQQEIQVLQQEVNSLSGEVKQLKREKEQIAQTQRHVVQVQQGVVQRQQQIVTRQTQETQQISYINQQLPPSKQIKKQAAKQQVSQEMQGVSNVPVPTGAPSPQLQGERLTRGVTVTTSPYLGLRSAFDASDLVSNISTMNEDLRLLQQRETIEQAYRDANLAPFVSDRPLIELSGSLQAFGAYQEPFMGHTYSDIGLNKVEFDALSYVSPWVLGIMSFAYDSSPLPTLTNPNIQIVGTGQQVANSRIFLKRGFITIGDLHRFPFYLTLGQMFAPYGDYTSELLTNPLTQQLGQTNARTALLGFAKGGFYLEGYTFNGNAFVNNNSTSINNGGGNIGYKYSPDNSKFSFNVGGGVIGNIADSLGMQLVGSPSYGGPASNAFQGFAFNTATELLKRRVPGADAHGELDIGKLTLLGEYVASTQSFDPADLSFDGSGARPQALHTEADYSFRLINFPSVFTLAYDHSWQSWGIFLPKDSYVAELTTSLFKDTIEAIEYRHDQNYGSTDYASGIGFPTNVFAGGGGQNTVTVQAGYYF